MRAAGVPFFFKQHGEWLYERDSLTGTSLARDGSERVVNHAGGQGAHGEGAVVVKRVGKKAAGRVLDGRTHDEFPEVAGG
jgi:protein gp37